MHVGVVTLFPEMFSALSDYGVVGRAMNKGLATLELINPREFALDVHRTVDDRPYGGGPGMVMKFEPLAAAIEMAREQGPEGAPVICLSPQGKTFDQSAAARMAKLPGMILLAGRYEGIDERLLEAHVDEEVSLGDFVISGGEIAAMAVIDAAIRLIPGVLGDDESAMQDSFSDGLLDHPHYTRPEEAGGRKVPEALLSGDHARIARWRQKQALGRSFERRPDLLDRLNLSDEQKALLAEFISENK